MLTEVTGLILRETKYAETDKILTVLTAERGKLPVYAKGVRSYRNHFMSVSAQMCYNEFVLHEKQGKYWLREASPLAGFYRIRENLVSWALAQYVLEVLDQLCMTEVAEAGLLQLGLNTLYLLEQQERPPAFLKAVFEMRAAALAGFLPDLAACTRCGSAEGVFYLDVANGGIVCADCLAHGGNRPPADAYEAAASGVCLPLSPELLYALQYICSAPAKRVFSFALPPEAEVTLAVACETYLAWHTDRRFDSLQFYKDMVKTMPQNQPENEEPHG